MMDLIYLLEDDDSIRKLVIYALNSQGYEAKGFERPAEFWKAMGQAQPDLVLLDIMLPEEDGLTILKKLRDNGPTRRLPVIMLTAKDEEIDSLDGDEPKRNARSIEVNGINYRADKELVQETNLRCDLRRGGISRVRKSPFTEEERRTRALDYLDEHPFLRIQDYMAITGLKRSSANRELLRLSSDPASGITVSGYGSHRVYVRRKTEGDR